MYKKILIFLMVVLLPGIASAGTFSDSFEDGTFNHWDVVSGAWSIGSPSPIDGGKYADAGGSGVYLQKNNTFDTNYWTFDTNTSGATNTYFFRTSTGATNYCSIIVTVASVTSAHAGTCAALTDMVAVTTASGKWYRVVLTDNGSTFNYKVYNLSNSSQLMSSQDVSDSSTSTLYNNIKASSSAASGNWDTFYVSTLTPATTSTSISWGATEYTRGQTASFSWQITNDDWATFDRYFIRLYKNGILQDFSSFNIGCLCFSQLSIGTQTGTYSLLADEPGIWEVTLEKGILSYTLLSSSETRIRDYSSSYFLIPGTALIKTNVSVTYHVGIGGIQSGIEWFYLNNGIEQRERGINLGTTTDGTINVTFSKVGTYNVYLKTLTGTAQTLDTHTVITSFISGGIPTNNFLNNTIHLLPVNGTGGSGGTYSMNDVLYGNYTINGTTFAEEGVFFIDVYNSDSGAETAKFFEDFGGSVGLIDNGLYAYLISNNANQPNGQLTQFQPGNNSIRLMLQNPDFTYTVLATDTFILSRTNVAGYGLDVNPLNIVTGQNVNAIVTSPAATGSYLRITGKNNYNKTYPLTAGTRTITTSFDTPGIYGYNLYDSTGSIQMTTQVTVTIGATTTPTPTIQASSEITGLMSSKIFWALLFILGIMLAVAVKERRGQ